MIKTPVFIDGKQIGTCSRVRSSTDLVNFEADYSYHVDDFEPVPKQQSENKISTRFVEFIDSDQNGMEDVISELNSKVAKEDIETELVLKDLGEEYFLECMKLAINVIISFENEEVDVT